MPFFNADDRGFLEELSRICYCNPFVPDRIAYERAALGDAFDDSEAHWNINAGNLDFHPNVILLCQRADALIEDAAKRLDGGKARPTDDESRRFEDLSLFVLYHRYRQGFDRAILESEESKGGKAYRMYDDFVADAERYLKHLDRGPRILDDLPHLFAIFFQMRRAFHNIFNYIYGRSRSAAKLRAAVWQSIFTCNMPRYRRTMFSRMHDYTTLITGPSGTGKELVARAVGLSRYVPFDVESRKFTADFAGTFYSLNLSAMSPTLIESELFGHQRGAFTGAVADRAGWLEVCPPLGTVFLDEIGELDTAIQVKLLRVLQSRQFQRLGETATRNFEGKIIAATNRDIVAAMQEGDFRADFYYRLCSDIIETPSLRQRIADDPAELGHLIGLLAARVLNDVDEAVRVAEEVEAWVHENLGASYDWPGNVRELEQCVRNVLIRREYHPARTGGHGVHQRLAADFTAGELPADDILRRYCTLVYARVGSYEGAARELGLDRRTVKAKVDEDLLAELTGGA
ncbi:MAG: sigma-54-dependent Fis family transcriptional regulator [Phycisphaera sp.]|nr:sigma-54-dependent Fis family transcriptional regulator [Phycisphaera sp.]